VPPLPHLFLPEEGSRASFRNVFKEKDRTMDKILKQNSSKRIFPPDLSATHPYKTTGRIMVLYILTFTFLDSRRDDKRL
jgi:hypothetical protein